MRVNVTIGDNGINSVGLSLPNGNPVDGSGIAIGQVEPHRPGDPDFDTMANLFNTNVDPQEVFFMQFDDNQNPTPVTSSSPTVNGIVIVLPPPDPPINIEISEHAVQVAGVMISTDTNTPGTAGVSPKADLFSIGHTGVLSQEADAVATQFIATVNSGDVRAVNMSFGSILTGTDTTDGNSLLTQFVDWSASRHNVLYVISATQKYENGAPADLLVPSDNFNGITVARSAQIEGVYRKVSDQNDFSHTISDRTFVDLIAPGDDVLLASQNNNEITDNGTSLAAPHVTGTVALLQQYADFQIAAPAANWGGMATGVPEPGPTARRHEVMKAVLMNSADKIEDTTTTGKYLGMDRTVYKQDGSSTWFDSFAYNDAIEGGGEPWPLDDEMGAGHLNAKRALQQFKPGESDYDGGDIPNIGWDYDRVTVTETSHFNRYQFAEEFLEGNFISITLAWDRDVTFELDGGTQGQYDLGDSFYEFFEEDADDVIKDLDIYLLPKFAGNINQAVAASVATFGTVEHLFFEIPATDEYEFWIVQ